MASEIIFTNSAEKPVIGGVRIVALYISSQLLMNRLNKTESAVFLYCMFSLFLKDPFFPDYSDENLIFHKFYWDLRHSLAGNMT